MECIGRIDSNFMGWEWYIYRDNDGEVVVTDVGWDRPSKDQVYRAGDSRVPLVVQQYMTTRGYWPLAEWQEARKARYPGPVKVLEEDKVKAPSQPRYVREIGYIVAGDDFHGVAHYCDAEGRYDLTDPCVCEDGYPEWGLDTRQTIEKAIDSCSNAIDKLADRRVLHAMRWQGWWT